MCLIAEHSLGGVPYFPSMVIISVCLDVSKALTRYVNATHVGRLWFFLRCISVFIVNVSYWHPTPVVDPNCNFTPCLLIILNSRPHVMMLYILTFLNFLGSVVSHFLGTGTNLPSCHFSRSYWLCQNWLYNIRSQYIFA